MWYTLGDASLYIPNGNLPSILSIEWAIFKMDMGSTQRGYNMAHIINRKNCHVPVCQSFPRTVKAAADVEFRGHDNLQKKCASKLCEIMVQYL